MREASLIPDAMVQAVRRVTGEATAPLRARRAPAFGGGSHLEVHVAGWTVNVDPDTSTIGSGYRQVGGELTPARVRTEAEGIMRRAFPWAAELRYDWSEENGRGTARWQEWCGPVRMPTHVTVLATAVGAVHFSARRVENPPYPVWVLTRADAERIALERYTDYVIDGEPSLYLANERTAWDVTMALRPDLEDRAMGRDLRLDAITGEVFDEHVAGGIRKFIRRRRS